MRSLNFIILSHILFNCFAFSQGIFSELKENGDFDPSPQKKELSSFSETVIIKSRNKRILIITNTQQALKQGDFVTVLSNNVKIAKALVAKTQDRKTALKIINTQNNSYDQLTNRGQKIQIGRGDYTPTEGGANLSIGEEKFFTEIDSVLNEKNNKDKFDERSMITLGVGIYETIDNTKRKTYLTHYSLGYSYRIAGNFWFEGAYGYTNLKRFPKTDIITTLHSLRARLRYNFSLPAHTYFMPYMGAEFANAQVSEDQAFTPQEIDLLQTLNSVRAVGGFSIHKRLVPGWLVSLNLGTDGLYGGLSVAF